MIPHSRPWITTEDYDTVNELLLSGMIANGAKVEEFERALAEYFSCSNVVVCDSGTQAIYFSLLALGIGFGDEVILPTYVCHSVYDAVVETGAIPVLCDVGEHWVMEVENVQALITDKTKAIIVVHIFGIAADTESFLRLGIPVIEDCCQAFGTEDGGRKLGTIGTLGVYSFHATKCLTTGEGGAVVSDDEELINYIKKRFISKSVYSRMTDIQASIGISQLNRYENNLIKRKKIAKKYFDSLPISLTQKIYDVRKKTNFFRFPLHLTNKVDFCEIEKEFAKQGVIVRRGVDELLHRRYHLFSSGMYLNSEEKFRNTVSIPIHPNMTNDEIELVVDVVLKFNCKWGRLG